MKIVIVGPAYPFRGGIAHFGGCLHQELQHQGHQSYLINFRHQYPQLIFPGKSQYEENSFFANLKSARVLTPYNPFTYFPTLKKILELQPEVVIFNYFIPLLAPAYTFLIKKLNKKGVKTILLAHNVVAHEKWLFGSLLMKRMIQSSDMLLTLSESVYNDAVSLLNTVPNKVTKLFHPLYDFYNNNRYKPEEAKKKLALTGKKVILFFGYIKPYKGLDILIRSFSLIKKKFPESCLLIVGEVYGDVSFYEELSQRGGFPEDIININEYTADEKVELYFKAADVLALPYKHATQSGVVQIAYSMGVGVAATPVGGLPEMIINGETGILAASIKDEDFAAAVIEYLLLDKDQINGNIEQYKRQYSWESFVKRLINSLA